jgi:hypothetical protein
MQAVIIDRYLIRSGNGIQLSITPIKLLNRNPQFNIQNYHTLVYNTQTETNNVLNGLLRGDLTLQQLIAPGV